MFSNPHIDEISFVDDRRFCSDNTNTHIPHSTHTPHKARAYTHRGKLIGSEQVFQDRGFNGSMMKVESVLTEHAKPLAAMRSFADNGQIPELLQFKAVAANGGCLGLEKGRTVTLRNVVQGFWPRMRLMLLVSG